MNKINWRKFFLVFFLLLFLFASPSPLFAKDFYTIIQKNYRLTEEGNGFIHEEISLINQEPDLYVTEYSFSQSNLEVSNLKGWDKIGPLSIKSVKRGEEMIYSFSLNEKVIGKGQVLSFILEYEIPKLATKEGRLWRVILPKLSKENPPDEYVLNVKTPLSFGTLAFSSPYPKATKKDNKYWEYLFEKKDLSENGILLEFGSFQIYDFALTYHLENSNNEKAQREITLPPDTAYQNVQYDLIDPPPFNVIKDNDGNWLAKYIVLPKSALSIKVNGKAKIFPQAVKEESLSQGDWENYLKPDKYWESNNERIKEISSSFKTPRDIYDYVVGALDYDYQKVGKEITRMGALQVIDSPKAALCLEFADLFVALSRAAGIPAREIEGYAFTEDSKFRPLSLEGDILHAWVEYYDQKTSTWKAVDPTWGKTTGGFDYFNNFDMSHFTFVIHGTRSDYPFPAGAFKENSTDNGSGKDVNVSFGTSDILPKTDLMTILNFSKINPFNRLVSGRLEIKNVGTVALYNLPVKIEGSKNLKPLNNGEVVPYLLPYGSHLISLRLSSPVPFWKTLNEEITVVVGDQIVKKSVSANILPVIFLIIFLVIAIIIIFIILRRRKSKNSFAYPKPNC